MWWRSKGHRVSDAGAGGGVSSLHYDEGSLLQRDHAQVLCIIGRLQEGPRPGRVAQPQHPVLPPAHLGYGEDRQTGGWLGPRPWISTMRLFSFVTDDMLW
ncbi:hypothetical protein AGOR_G00208030 [Albula goreensis]|uniref:Uncharacterized protein n=1 Tax=Albula goreensis TaxID=1534307 RepID=A0A8T3CPB6_9TELE|nr:hypothetical protein AGOR_G00208030 [Albula goreensis]